MAGPSSTTEAIEIWYQVPGRREMKLNFSGKYISDLVDAIWEKEGEAEFISAASLLTLQIQDTNNDELVEIDRNLLKGVGGFQKLVNKYSIDDDNPIIVKSLQDIGPPPKKLKMENNKQILDAQKLFEAIGKTKTNVDDYSDPTKIITLPFPFIGNRRPSERFTIKDDDTFEYMGRKMFADVKKEVDKFNANAGICSLFVYGTIGYGKSHILAALAHSLFNEGKRVVYLPDCRAMLKKSILYLQEALSLTFGDKPNYLQEIDSFESEKDIIKFCDKRLKEGLNMYFIIDQVNALDHAATNRDTIDNTTKTELQKFLDDVIGDHFVIKSASANYQSYQRLHTKQMNELKISLYSGLSETEIVEWWKQYDQDLPKFDDGDKKYIEDITGRIPLVLNAFKGYGGKNFEDVKAEILEKDAFTKVSAQVHDFSNSLGGPKMDYESHIKLMKKFLIQQHAGTFVQPELYDHRYFYVDSEGFARPVCGLARDAIATVVFKHNKNLFLDQYWLEAIPKFGDNPSVLGFLVEYSCLAQIASSGFHAMKQMFKPDKTYFFSGNFPSYDTDRSATLYIPEKFNFKAIDGLFLKTFTEEVEEVKEASDGVRRHSERIAATKSQDVQPKKSQKKRTVAKKKLKCVHLLPIQITISPSHSDSIASFFDDLDQYSSALQQNNYDKIYYTFVWIKDIDRAKTSSMTYKENTYTPKGQGQKGTIKHPEFTELTLSIVDISREIDKKLQVVRARQHSGGRGEESSTTVIPPTE